MEIEPKFRHPDCPEVHLGVCAKCRRLYAASLTNLEAPMPVKNRATPAAEVVERRVDEAPKPLPPHLKEVLDAVDGDVEAAAEIVARSFTEALIDAVIPLTPAEKQKRHRAKIKADPLLYAAYLEAERKRKAR